MNKARRKILDQLTTELTDIRERLAEVCNEEQEAYDNLPEGLQASENGERAQTAADALSSACDELETALTSIDEALQA